MTETVPPFSELIARTTSTAVHLEMRDTYTPHDQDFQAWLSGQPVTALLGSPDHQQWAGIVRTHVSRGVAIRRARIVSEPLADFIRYEHQMTGYLNVPAGEQVRWLTRRRTSGLCLPGNDFWLFDCSLVRFGYFAGNGEFIGHELTDDPAIARLCSASFEAVWQRAVDHSVYQPLH
jgi:hypothetical protein